MNVFARARSVRQRVRPAVAPPSKRDATQVLVANPDDAQGTVSSGRLNAIAPIISAQRYLEIGVRKGETIEAVRIAQRVGVDPEPAFDVTSLPAGVTVVPRPSDDYFRSLAADVTFDLVFVDGLHEFRQSYRDVIHVLAHLATEGVVLIDDVVPTSAIAAIPDLDAARQAAVATGGKLRDWMGDVFRTALALCTLHPELETRTIVDEDGRGQMVVWRTDPHVRTASPSADPDSLDALMAHTFESTFGAGVPSVLRPATLAEILRSLEHRAVDRA
jgi:hypothetical protein